MALGLTDPLTALSFSAMPLEQLTEYHRAWWPPGGTSTTGGG